MKARDASCPGGRPPCNLHFQVRAEILTTYALCGFANFSSIGIMLGGLSESRAGQLPGDRRTPGEGGEGWWDNMQSKGWRSQVNGGQTPSPQPLSAPFPAPYIHTHTHTHTHSKKM